MVSVQFLEQWFKANSHIAHYFLYDLTILLLSPFRERHIILQPRMFCAKFMLNWLIGSEEEFSFLYM